MKTSLKASLIIIVALALLACLVVLTSRPGELDEPTVASGPETLRGQSFEVSVVMPRSALPFGGILPGWLTARMDATPREVGFNHASRGAQVGSVGHDRLELRADGWDLLVETDGEGHVAPGTRLVFPLRLGGRDVRLRCRPADRPTGHLSAVTRAGSDVLDGRFLVELAACENAVSRKAIEWPPAPLTVRASFEGLPHGRR